MAKANLVLPDGTTVNIDGTADEVAILLGKFSSQEPNSKRKTKRRKPTKSKVSKARTKTGGPTSLITGLAEEGYFKSKRTIGDIQKKLEEMGHIYSQQSISSPLFRLTRQRVIRRIKEKKVWVYIN